MASDEKPTCYAVLPTHHGKLVAPPILCDTLRAAEQAAEDARDTDEAGFYAEYRIRPLTLSELAYLLAA